MELQPKRPPGRADRKAAAYAVKIVLLRRAGFTYEAIREAFADIGIELSTSALRREVRRLHNRPTAVVPVSPSIPRPAASNGAGTPPSAPSAPASISAGPTGSRGHDIAEAFFNAHPSNPLLRTKELP